MINGPLMVDIEGLQVTEVEVEMLCHPLVSGVILFARNFESVSQLTDLVQQIRDVRDPRLYIAVDQEGGRVQRFHGEFSELPALRGLGHLYDADQAAAIETSEALGWLMAAEMKSVGIDISFAPVLDLDRSISEVIGSRAFAAGSEAVSTLARAYVKGMNKAGMAATGKHFPGHGSVKADSHVALPIDERPFSIIEQEDLVPFKELITADIQAMMVSHVIYPDQDTMPAGFSSHWVKNILRKSLKFNGIIFSDDITMQAAASVGDHVQRAKLAVLAGCDCVIACNDTEGRNLILDKLDMTSIDAQSTVRDSGFASLKTESPLSFAELKKNALWSHAHDRIEHLLKTLEAL